MSSTKNLTVILILFLLAFGFLLPHPFHQSLSAEDINVNKVFSISAVNEPLREVLKKISKASGYEIRFNTQYATERISIQLDDVTLNESLKRVLQAYNYMTLWDDENNIITLLIFKESGPPVTLSGMNRIFELATETTSSP